MIEDTDTLELLDRFDFLVQKYVPLAAQLAPLLQKFGKYRQELQQIAVELQKRGVEPKDHNELIEIIDSLQNQKTDENTNTTEGLGQS